MTPNERLAQAVGFEQIGHPDDDDSSAWLCREPYYCHSLPPQFDKDPGATARWLLPWLHAKMAEISHDAHISMESGFNGDTGWSVHVTWRPKLDNLIYAHVGGDTWAEAIVNLCHAVLDAKEAP